MSFKHICKNSDTLIVSFAGMAKLFGGLQQFEFEKCLDTKDSSIVSFDKQFYLDIHLQCYHKGIDGISTNINETIDYLREQIKPYKKIIFIGASGGGYASILFGSVLQVQTVIAFFPPTILKSENPCIDETYRNLKNHINKITKYYIYGDENITDEHSCHHISHCENIAGYKNENVRLIRRRGINLKHMRDTGELLEIICNNSL